MSEVAWRHLVVDLVDWRLVPEMLDGQSRTSVAFTGGSTTMLVAANAGRFTQAFYVWQHVGADVPASIVARDVKTLAWLVDLRGVILWSDRGDIEEDAEIVAALLTRDDVTIEGGHDRVRGAWNRPRPPHPLEIWVSESPPGAEVSLDLLFDGERRVGNQPRSK